MTKKMNVTRRKLNNRGTRKNNGTRVNGSVYANFEREITMKFFEMLY